MHFHDIRVIRSGAGAVLWVQWYGVLLGDSAQSVEKSLLRSHSNLYNTRA